MFANYILFAVALTLCVAADDIEITEFSVPSSVHLGDNATLHCGYDTDRFGTWVISKWWWKSPEGTHKLLVQRDEENPIQVVYKDLCTNIVEDGEFSVTLIDVNPSASGLFSCEVFHKGNGAEDRKAAVLNVFSEGTGAKLGNVTVLPAVGESKEQVILTCEAHDVTPEPILSLYLNGKELEGSDVVTTVGDLYSVSRSATVDRDEAEDAELKCELFYKNEDVVHPAYTDTLVYDSVQDEVITEIAETLENFAQVYANYTTDGASCMKIATSVLLLSSLVTALMIGNF